MTSPIPLTSFSTKDMSPLCDENSQVPSGLYEDNSCLWLALNTLCFPLICCCSYEQLNPAQIGVVTKYSRPVRILDEPGNHFLPPIGTRVVKVYVGENLLSIRSKTKDSNATKIIVSANLIYKINNVMEILNRQNSGLDVSKIKCNEFDRCMHPYAESAIEEVASRFPYDAPNEVSTTTSKVAKDCFCKVSQTINDDLLNTVKRLAIDSGMEILSFKITSVYKEKLCNGLKEPYGTIDPTLKILKY